MDSSDILRKLNDIQLEENMYIVTCDVESLYTSINGLEAVRFFLAASGLDLEFGGRERLHTYRFIPQKDGDQFPITWQFITSVKPHQEYTGFWIEVTKKTWVRAGYQRAKQSNRDQLLVEKSRSRTISKVRCISTFNSQSNEMRNALSKYWDILKRNPILSQYVDNYPSNLFRRSENLRDILVRSHYRGLSPERAFGSKGPKWGCQRWLCSMLQLWYCHLFCQLNRLQRISYFVLWFHMA